MNRVVEPTEERQLPAVGSTYDYSVYGLRLRCQFRLALPELLFEACPDVAFVPGTPDQFSDAVSGLMLDPSEWIHQHELASGWSYIRYDDMFDFLVAPDGNRIIYRLLGEFSLEAFQTYALGRVFSFALVKLGIEPLHAATVVVDGRAIAFLGASTFGKSSLAACFVAAGHPLLTDDVLRTQEQARRFMAFPGPPRLKLFPKVARMFLGDSSRGVQMKPGATKLVFPLAPPQSHASPAPLAVIYVIAAPRDVHHKQRIVIEAHRPIPALLKLLRFTHNAHLTDAARLERQFAAARRVTEVVPVQRLSYARVLSSLPEVRDAVLADLDVEK